MFGTVARIRVKPDREADLTHHLDDFGDIGVAGFVASALYKADAGGQEYWLAVIFESQEAYRANADSPEQNARFETLMSYLEAEPEWHDGEVLGRWTGGG